MVKIQRALIIGVSTSGSGNKAFTRLVNWNGDVLSAYESTGLLLSSYQAGVKTTNGQFFLVGRRESSSSYWAGLISLFSKDGDHLWSKQFGTSGYEYVQSVARSRDGRVVVIGGMRRASATLNSIVVIKLTAKGEVEWAKSIYSGKKDEPLQVISTHDGGYAAVGAIKCCF